MPGIIDCHSHIATDAINEGDVVTSMVGIEDVLDPDDIAIYRALAGGVTTANMLHGSANAIGGKNEVIKLRWGRSRPRVAVRGRAAGHQVRAGREPEGHAAVRPAGPARLPATRMGVEDVIRDAFTRAKAYQDEWEDDAARKQKDAGRRSAAARPAARAAGGDPGGQAPGARALLPRGRDPDAAAPGRGVRLQGRDVQHVLEGYKVADEIAAHGAGASTFCDWWGYKVEAYDAIP